MSDASSGFAQWLAEARAGSGDALGQLLDSCRGYLLMIARQELDPDLVAKGGPSDLVQETFLDAHRDFPHFHGDSEAELLAWLRRVLLNNLANFARRYREAEMRQVQREVALDAGPSSPNAPALPADMSTPSEHAMANERALALQRALARLPDDYRRVLLLRHQEERSFAEIAEAMNRSPNAVHKLWVRAVERLQQELEAPP
jgi:RNA polymerase sigma-70 factor (ECF subfamily)